MLSAAPLEGALDVLSEAGIDAVRQKSLALTGYLIALADERLGDAFAVGTPRDPARRGGHVAIEHPEARSISRALEDRGVIVDFRPPNVVRICPAPLYTSYVDIWNSVAELKAIAASRAYEDIEDDGTVT